MLLEFIPVQIYLLRLRVIFDFNLVANSQGQWCKIAFIGFKGAIKFAYGAQRTDPAMFSAMTPANYPIR
jgi:hypothetical protein